MENPRAVYDAIGGSSGHLPGLLSVTIWEVEVQPDMWLCLLHHDSEKNRAASVAVMVKDSAFDKIQDYLTSVPDIRVVSIDAAGGVPPGNTDIGTWMSIASHDAPIGEDVFTARAALDISRELQAVRGFIGAIIGRSAANEHEVFSLGFWREREHMHAELPMRFETDVRVLRRIL